MDEAKRRNLVVRVASGLVLFPLAVWLTWLGDWWFAALASAAAVVAAGELMAMFGPIGAGEVFGMAVAGAIPLATAREVLSSPSSTAGFGELLPGWAGLGLAFATIALLVFFLFRRVALEQVPSRMGAVVLSWLYCGLLVASVVGLRLRREGFSWVIIAFVVTWGNDTFAYFAGHFFGKHKLYERISPKKTWEGFAGGAVGSIGCALAARAILRATTGELADLGVLATLVTGAGGAALGPLGDLAESMVKRAAGVKDSGKIIPGHGGLLDRIDALLFVAPWVFVCAEYLR